LQIGREKKKISQCGVLNPYPGDVNAAKIRIGEGVECRWGHIDVGYFASGAAVGDVQLDTLVLVWEKGRSGRLISIDRLFIWLLPLRLTCDYDLAIADGVVVGVHIIVATAKQR
jgi:hypothetical protein